MKRLLRALELARLFGPFDPDVWRTLFPPYHGWDTSCRSCKHCPAANLAKRCARGERLGFWKCGETENA